MMSCLLENASRGCPRCAKEVLPLVVHTKVSMRKRGVAPRSTYKCSSLRTIPSYDDLLTRECKQGLPEMRKRGVAPRGTYKSEHVYI